jgi:mRNA-degrading endonuclease RelE of RelBE toxin-antitoxin system
MRTLFPEIWAAVYSRLPATGTWGSIATFRRRHMRYEIEFLRSALEQLRALPKDARRLIGRKIDTAQTDLAGDIKKLKGFKKKYRLRAGNYRVLFELEGACLVV